MFGNGTIGVLLVVLAISISTRETPLFILCLGLLLASALSRLWQRYCLARIEYRRSFNRTSVSYGETVEMEVEIVNRKLLPLSWLEIEDEIPSQLPPSRGRLFRSHKPDRSLLTNLVSTKPYERIRRRYQIPCLSRGEHSFGPVHLRSGDLFGFASSTKTIDQSDTLVVCPRVVPLAALGFPARAPLGDVRVQDWILEDPSRLAGVREYRPGDSLHRVHWPASARLHQLQSRVYEATTSHKLALFLNLDTNEISAWGFGYDPDVLELSITTAASIAAWGLEKGYQVGVFTNGMRKRHAGKLFVLPGRGTGQLERILTALGRLEPMSIGHFSNLLLDGSGELSRGATVVAISAGISPREARALSELRRRGYPVTAVLTGRQEHELPRGIVSRRIGPPEIWKDAALLEVRVQPSAAAGAINGATEAPAVAGSGAAT